MDNNLNNWILSFSGCDGGDINSDTWLCGIEWGYPNATDKEREDFYKIKLPQEIEQGSVKLNSDYNFFTSKSMEYPFNRGFAKLYSACASGSIKKSYKSAGNILKLNLSPIGFWRDEEYLWSKYNLSRTTGFESKKEFIGFLNSLNRFTALRAKKKPKLIVCVGVGRRSDFIKCFFGEKKVKLQRQKLIPQSPKNQNKRYLYHAEHDGTLLVIVPFFTSTNGLNSNYLLQKAGEEISRLLGVKLLFQQAYNKSINEGLANCVP